MVSWSKSLKHLHSLTARVTSGRRTSLTERWCIEMPRSFLLCLWCFACLFGCSREQPRTAKRPDSIEPQASKTITLATTTSTQDSGLLDELLPAFERESGIVVKVVAVGSGQAAPPRCRS